MQKEHCFSSNATAASAEKMRSSPFFSIPGLFVGFTAKCKGLSDSADAVRSPTSPLDHKLFSLQFPKSPERSWDCSRVGLGLLNSLSDEKNLSRAGGKNILMAPQMRTINTPGPKSAPLSSNGCGEHAKSLPKDYGVSTPLRARSLLSQLGSFEKIDSCCPTDHKSQPKSDAFASNSKNPELDSVPLLSGSLPILIDSIHGYMGSLISASEIELSEDYTCIISHGPNPKTTHIFGDYILQKYVLESLDSSKSKQGEKGGVPHWIVQRSENSPPLPHSNDFLSFCCSCNSKLEAGRDIYMYRGEIAFCSCNCRDRAILLEDEMEMEKPTAATGSCDSASSSSFHEEEYHFLERNGSF